MTIFIVLGIVVSWFSEKRIKSEQQLQKSEERFRLTVEAAPHALVLADREGRIALVNSQTELLFGYGREELIGQPVEMLIPARLRGRHTDYRAAFSARPEARPMGAGRDLFGLRKDGTEVPIEIGLNPLETEEGLMVLSSVADITERKQAEEALRESERRLRFALQSAEAGTWDWDPPSGRILWSEEYYALYGLDPEQWQPSYESWLATVHPVDRERAAGAVRRVIGIGRGWPVPHSFFFLLLSLSLALCRSSRLNPAAQSW